MNASHLDCLKQRWDPLTLGERIHDSANNSKRPYESIFPLKFGRRN